MTATQPPDITAPTADPAGESSDTAAPAVAVRGLSHTYPPIKQRKRRGRQAPPPPDRTALQAVSLKVRTGEVFGLLGPNGSGKSTLFRILATVQEAAPPADTPRGSASIFGLDVDTDPAGVRRQIGVVFQNPSLDDKLTARENLRYHGMLHGITGEALRQRSAAVLDAVGLADRAGEHIAGFSGGMRRRIEIAKALLPCPRLLLMDEASTGLDPAAQQALWQTLRTQVNDHGLTVLLTTHLMHEAEHCDRLAVLAEGRVVAVDTPDRLVDRVGGQVLEIDWAKPAGTADSHPALAQEVADHLGLAPDAPGLRATEEGLRAELGDAAAAVPGVSALLGDRARSIRVARPTLEDAYLSLTGTRL